MSNSATVLFFILLGAYLLATGWYIRAVIVLDRKPAKPKPYETTRRVRNKKSGKKCPGCGKVIDQRRRHCQYCHHQFQVPPDTPLHPEEILQDKFDQRNHPKPDASPLTIEKEQEEIED